MTGGYRPNTPFRRTVTHPGFGPLSSDREAALSRGDSSTYVRCTVGLTNLGSLVLVVRALEGRWISS